MDGALACARTLLGESGESSDGGFIPLEETEAPVRVGFFLGFRGVELSSVPCGIILTRPCGANKVPRGAFFCPPVWDYFDSVWSNWSSRGTFFCPVWDHFDSVWSNWSSAWNFLIIGFSLSCYGFGLFN